MKIPKKVKIGGHNFEIILFNPTPMDRGDCGRSKRSDGKIYIANDLMQSQKEVTFFHEIIHLLNGETKELECDFWAEAIYAFLKDNKLLR